MSNHGVCQKRRRLILTSCPDLEIKIVKSPSIEQILVPPRGTRYITNMTWRPSRTKDDLFQGNIVKLIPKQTISYTILGTPCWFLNASEKAIRKFSVEDNMAIQTFPPNYFNKDMHLSDSKRRQMVANAVPPMFAYLLSKAIDACL